MLNSIWLSMLVLSVVVGLLQGQLDAVVQAVTDSAKQAFEIALHLVGIMALWLGIMNIAAESGLVARLARFMQPLMSRLFPDVPPEHPAMGAMIMNISANVLGLANAATPFGLQAMKELQRLNHHAHVASNAMCTFLAINTSSVQLIPVTAIAYLSANGASHPTEIIVSTLVATIASTIVAVVAVKTFERWAYFRIPHEDKK